MTLLYPLRNPQFKMTALALFTNCGTLRVIKTEILLFGRMLFQGLSRLFLFTFTLLLLLYYFLSYFLVCHFHIRVVRFNWYCHVLKLKNTNNYLKLWPLKDASSPQLMLIRKIFFLIFLWAPLGCSFILSFLFHILFAIVEKKVRSSEKLCHLPRFVVVIPLFQWQLLLISDICWNVFFFQAVVRTVDVSAAERTWNVNKRYIHSKRQTRSSIKRRRLW